jgi:hypothetical protein
MRRVREYRNTFGTGANPRWTDEMVAALIREAGSERERVENDPNYWFYFADRVGEKIGWPFYKT